MICKYDVCLDIAYIFSHSVVFVCWTIIEDIEQVFSDNHYNMWSTGSQHIVNGTII